jgi:microtubule-associated protein-like 6
MSSVSLLSHRPATACLPAGKIQYRECKKGVWPPSDWDPALAARSSQLPDSRLTLEFVYGYDGWVRGQGWREGGAQVVGQ